VKERQVQLDFLDTVVLQTYLATKVSAPSCLGWRSPATLAPRAINLRNTRHFAALMPRRVPLSQIAPRETVALTHVHLTR